jgi:hypothetical protein
VQNALTIGAFMGEKHGAVPLVVRASGYLWLANAVIYGIVPLITMGTQLPGGILLWIGMALALLLTALLSVAAVRLLRGIGRARTVLTVVAILWLTTIPTALSNPLAAPSALTYTGLILTLVGTILMWLPASSAYYKRASASVAT